MKNYTWGAAGHLEEVAAGANVLDFGADAEGRLSGASRTAADVSATVSYDGRSFLTHAVEMTGDPPGEGASVEAVYDSFGLLHTLRRKAVPSNPKELVVHFYLAARPVAQLAIDGAGAETWTYITPDHLGTPLLATDESGAVTWEGGLEPFGRDYQAGTPAGALENGIYLRLPGQWQDTAWADATSGAGIAYNVARWLQPGTGNYTRPDPFGLRFGERPYLYARGNPLIWLDPLGLQAVPPLPGRRDPFVPPFPPGFPSGPWGDRPDPDCCDKEKVDQRIKKAGLLAEGKEAVEIQGADSTVRGLRHEGGPWFSPVPPTQPFERPCTESDPCVNFCCNVHEYYHYGDTRWINLNWNQQILHNHQEAPAYGVEQACLRAFLSGG